MTYEQYIKSCEDHKQWCIDQEKAAQAEAKADERLTKRKKK